ncbi:MAG: glycosyltransferase [Candidatus Gastranaerophilales bacterium]|nr:glycosyltransferase [Candidatus Gastranaerophilales bacterium]
MGKQFYSLVLFLFASLLLLLGVIYVSWRAVVTLNFLESPFTTFWSYALLGAELITLVVFTNFSLILIKSGTIQDVFIDNVLQNDYTKDIYKDGNLITFKNFCPSVDIFICTINEDPDMLATTISACQNIDYPNKKVYVLDDGRRPQVKELAELFGANYIIRQTNKGFKAGNINNALSLTDSDLVVIFDADHIPSSTFLKETVYNFVNDNVALVQTPQHFCNPDAFQKNLSVGKFLANEQDMFYRIIEPGLNEFGSVFCGGTNIIIRRKHLNSVGNFPETSITEDSLLGLKFHSMGYEVIYYNRPIAIGLAASTFEEYIKQRCRWAKGNIQIMTDPDNWKYYRKLKPIQAFFYLSGAMYFITPISRMIFLLAPVLFLFFDISPVVILFYQIIAFQLCYFSLKFAFIFTNCIKIKNIILADVYDLVTSVFTIGSILHTLLIPKRFCLHNFCVTKKDLLALPEGNSRYMIPLGILFAVLVAAQFQGIYDLLYSEVYSKLAIVANLFWNSINILVMAFALQVVDEKPEKRLYQRVKMDETLILRDENIRFETHLEDVSRSGLKFFMPDEFKGNEKKDFVADIEGEADEIELLDCADEKGKYVCKSKFKQPISLLRFTKLQIARINRFVRFVYKKPDAWDEIFKNNKKR